MIIRYLDPIGPDDDLDTPGQRRPSSCSHFPCEILTNKCRTAKALTTAKSST